VVVYKLLTFLLIEQFQDLATRELILRNLQFLFSKFAQIPSEVALDPYIKQLHVADGQKPA